MPFEDLWFHWMRLCERTNGRAVHSPHRHDLVRGHSSCRQRKNDSAFEFTVTEYAKHFWFLSKRKHYKLIAKCAVAANRKHVLCHKLRTRRLGFPWESRIKKTNAAQTGTFSSDSNFTNGVPGCSISANFVAKNTIFCVRILSLDILSLEFAHSTST